MKNLKDYIKENIDIENFEYKFDVWFEKDKTFLKPLLDLIKECQARRIITKEDVLNFIGHYPDFPIKKFVDFFDENVTREESINVDYVYLFMIILKNFITDFNLNNKVDYMLQGINNGVPNI